MANELHITTCDNELIIIAYQWGASFEICTIFSGNNNVVDVKIPLQTGVYTRGVHLNGVSSPLTGTYNVNLAEGDYSLVAMGVNWGGPQGFSFTLNGTTYDSSKAPDGNGLVWNTDPIAVKLG